MSAKWRKGWSLLLSIAMLLGMMPMTAMAATCKEESYCCLECEKFILRKLNIGFDEEMLLQNAIQNGWQKENGTALHNVGRHLENKGLLVTRQYNASVEDIAAALNENESVIVAVDGGELIGNRADEIFEDHMVGQIPDHTVVVLSLNFNHDTITIYDPDSSKAEDTYSIEQFKEYGLEIVFYTRDLHASEMAATNIVTEYEKRFTEMGQNIFSAHVKFPVKDEK